MASRPRETEREKVNLPPRIFLYTPDQIATLLSMRVQYVTQTLLFYDRREAGIRPKGRLIAVNIAPDGEPPEWRVQESELLRYLRYKGIKFYDRGLG